jgi:5-methylcytosine-specific restriction protein A
MPDLPEQHNPRPRKPWHKDASSPARITGRTLQRINDRIKRRDQWTCQQCGKVTAHLQVDHIKPLSEGGNESDQNKQSLCVPCHEKKSAAECHRAKQRESQKI